MATKKPTRKPTAKSGKPQAGTSVELRIGIDVTEDTPTYYANFFEVGQSQTEFMLNVVRVPPKPSAAQMQEAKENGILMLHPELQILFSPRSAKGIVKALSAQIALYEANHGKIIPGDSDE